MGGYCSNEILVNLIKYNLKKITTYLQPSNPSLAIREGAVLFGIEPSTINIRKAKYTIGKEVAAEWNDKVHSEKGKKFYSEYYKKFFCRGCFIKFIEVNQNLNYGEKISHIEYLDNWINQKKTDQSDIHNSCSCLRPSCP